MNAALEDMARQLQASGDYEVLRVFKPVERYHEDDGSQKRIGLLLDCETTGTNYRSDKVIELALVKFEYCPRSGRIFRILDRFDEFNDPGFPIPEAIVRLTRITDDMVAGQAIDLERLAAFVEGCNLVISHNAGFDRKFVERIWDGFRHLPWACTMNQIAWEDEEIGGRKLDYIAMRLGFCFRNAHRAIDDCLATLHVLAQTLPVSGRPVLLALLGRARETTWRVYAVDTKFEMKDVLKGRGYQWNDGSNGRPKSWNIEVPAAALELELDYLRTNIYRMPLIKIPTQEIQALDRFSERC